MLLGIAPGAAALTPSQVLDKAYASIAGSKGVTATYTITSGRHKSTGKISAAGNKFCIDSSGIITWYDGKTQWNYNAATSEVTVSTPTPAEVASISPYALISSYKTLYNLKSLTSKIPGTYAIQLRPKNSKSPIKNAVLYIRSKDFQPCRLDVTPQQGSASSVVITSIKTGLNLPASTFVFPKGKYPKAQVIDLR